MGARESGTPTPEAWLELSRQIQDLLTIAIRRSEWNPGRLLQIARLAGRLAWNAHPGSFVLAEVERALRDMPALDRGAPAALPAAGSIAGRTLHVLTEAYEIGGHTRLVRRFIQAAEEDAAVVLVRQRAAFSPAWVAPGRKSVPVIDLETLGVRDEVRKVAALRHLFQEAARVVLHIHPDDAVSVAAAGRAPEADIRFYNHADHVAWLGAALPSLLINARASGARLAVRRRGVPESRHALLPVPLEVPRPVSRHDARARLGIGASQRLILTVASAYKYNPVGGRSLVEALTAALERPDITLVAIGPGPAHPVFARLADRFPGRVQSLGVIPDPYDFRAAADLYLDSYPFCSPTSLFESALVGTPVVAFQPDFEALEVLYNQCPGVNRGDFAAGDPTLFARLVSDLLDSPARRDSMLHAFQRGVGPSLPEAWKATWAGMLPRRSRGGDWTAPEIPVEPKLLDRVLAGLGRNPRDLLGQSGWKVTGIRTRLRVLALRLRHRAAVQRLIQ